MELAKFINEIKIKTERIQRSLYKELALSSTPSSGKFLRSKLTWYLQTAKPANTKKDYKFMLELCVVIELLHFASLIIDDIIDKSEYRRFKETVWKKDGISKALLLGNYIYIEAFNMLTVQPFCKRYLTMFIKFSGSLLKGEIKDEIKFKNKKLNQKNYLEMVREKTGALFALAAVASNYNGSLKNDKLYLDIGINIGALYQLYDDTVDLTGDESVIGKTLNIDIRNGKKNISNTKGIAPGYKLIRSEYLSLTDNLLKTNKKITNSLNAYFKNELPGIYNIITG